MIDGQANYGMTAMARAGCELRNFATRTQSQTFAT
jgi:hypothetical protein